LTLWIAHTFVFNRFSVTPPAGSCQSGERLWQKHGACHHQRP
jgi:hypothetical protein